MSGQSVEERAAEVLDKSNGEWLDRWEPGCPDPFTYQASALAAAGLLVSDDTERWVKLGQAVEAQQRAPVRTYMHGAPMAHNDVLNLGSNLRLDAIYREAGVTP